MTCSELRPLIACRPLEVLEEREQADLEAHLAECVTCRLRSAELDLAYELLKDSGEEPQPSAELWEGLASRLDEDAKTLVAPAPEPRSLPIALVCSFCHDVLTRELTHYCASCLAPHHAECFRTHGRCSAPGCEETHTVQANRTVHRGWRRGRLGYLGLGVLLVGGGLAALVGKTMSEAQRMAELERARALQAAHEARLRAKDEAEHADRAQMRAEAEAERAEAMRAEAEAERRRAMSAQDRALESLRKAERSRRYFGNLYLGARLLPTKSGLQVVDLKKNGLAARFGLRRQDVLLAINDQKVADLAGVRRVLTAYTRPSIRFMLRRQGKVRNQHCKVPNLKFKGFVPARVLLGTSEYFQVEVADDGNLRGQWFEVHLGPSGQDLKDPSPTPKLEAYLEVTRWVRRPVDSGWDLPAVWTCRMRRIAEDQPYEGTIRSGSDLYLREIAAVQPSQRVAFPRVPRVLYVEGEPRTQLQHLVRALSGGAGERFSWRSSLSYSTTFSDPAVIDPVTRGLPPPLEEMPNTLAEFDVLILGDVAAKDLRGFGGVDAVRSFVERGGGLVLVPGARGLDPRLQDLSPVVPRPGKLRTVKRFRSVDSDHSLVASLRQPGGRFLLPALPAVRPGALRTKATSLLADADTDHPIIAIHSAGWGRVTWIGSDELWRWRVELGDRILDRFWQDVVGELDRIRSTRRAPWINSVEQKRDGLLISWDPPPRAEALVVEGKREGYSRFQTWGRLDGGNKKYVARDQPLDVGTRYVIRVRAIFSDGPDVCSAVVRFTVGRRPPRRVR